MEKHDRINLILNHKNFKTYLLKNMEYENGRKFCLHNLEHFLDVARIAYIMVLEKNLAIKKDIIYASALLHDIGRWQQYESGISHSKASSILAANILKDCEFNDSESTLIIEAIKSHGEANTLSDLSAILYKSDKLSRNCFNCSAYKECNWSYNKKNSSIIY
ncbi:uncharacterized protein BJV85_000971 [Clostridium acetobutylicum]|uniref:HD superfamily hydrolase n=1 Tax=Clostridium acetobutylicum (strain ATCC 824 / DSM 792 / JCM 1419 / IAM 19013 / LMG 5710 / NBRC 13948 / NRRL B-527 / VKM B-1787 / 2291 / W) TaxID=272562 RepID=Q97F30_CLOAB|nr:MULTISPECIES: HD domain-containing protein [Clostridium]AAK80867.1 HD superfamily hydrolase [Clostridium acetobutylicum ATCC 824]ADZ21969.1 HD superfamily hydrolase [Clostridium acetobutylicum EA 2018]AEI32609.1 HD superfamily hydrolase [Clostridium acetobutylicum DSM 1731]AWV78721.1 HD domain-containing protein [Clostridium acetobutylicum]KHD37228.1 hypothetical protein NL50_07860 [Clostridium acetobutylicum]